MTLQNLIQQAKNYLHNAQDKQDINYKVSQWLTSDLLNKTILSLQEKGLSENAILVKINQQIEAFKVQQAKDDFFTFATLISKQFDPLVKMDFETYKMSCEVLQACLENRLYSKKDDQFVRIDFLFFNACPSWGKSYLVTRLLNIWWFAKNNLIHFLITANEKNRKKIMHDISALLQIPNFTKIFNDFKLVKNNDGEKVSTSGGWLNMNPSRSDITGNRGDLFIFDDFDKPTHLGRAEFETSKDFLNMYLTRGFKNKITKNIVVMQRIDKKDTTGYLQDIFNASGQEYATIAIPYKFTEDTTYTFYIQNAKTQEIEKKEWFFQQNTFSNYYFNEEKWDGEVLGKECQGSVYKRETQYQQNPTQANEQIISIKDHHYYNSQDISQFNFNHIIISVDAASSDNVGSDYTAMLCFGIRDKAHYLLELMRVKCVYDDMERQFAQFYAMCQNDYQTPTFVIVEDKSNGSALLSRLCSYRVINPNTQQPINACFYAMKPIVNKVERLREVSGHINNDYFKIPIDRKGIADYVFELEQFPNAKNDDYVDATSQYIKKMHEILYGA